MRLLEGCATDGCVELYVATPLHAYDSYLHIITTKARGLASLAVEADSGEPTSTARASGSRDGRSFQRHCVLDTARTRPARLQDEQFMDVRRTVALMLEQQGETRGAGASAQHQQVGDAHQQQ
jgi:hypothetical protein